MEENTSVVNPKITNELEKDLINKGVIILKGEKLNKIQPKTKIYYVVVKLYIKGILINCKGLEAAPQIAYNLM